LASTFDKYFWEEVSHHKGRNTNILKANKSSVALRPAAICFAFPVYSLTLK
jgi:hypothetical protein